MDYLTLNTEIITDPLGRGYSGMTDAEVAVDLNTAYRSVNKTKMLGSEIWENTVAADYSSLTDSKKTEWLSFCGISEVDPFGPAAAFVQYIFGAGSQTVINLNAERIQTITRAEELFNDIVSADHVTRARSM